MGTSTPAHLRALAQARPGTGAAPRDPRPSAWRRADPEATSGAMPVTWIHDPYVLADRRGGVGPVQPPAPPRPRRPDPAPWTDNPRDRLTEGDIDAALHDRLDAVVDVVCRLFSVRHGDVCGEGRGRNVSLARQVAMGLLYDEGLTKMAIGRYLGRDHSTVCHGLARVREGGAHYDHFLRAREEVAAASDDSPLLAKAAHDRALGVLRRRLRRVQSEPQIGHVLTAVAAHCGWDRAAARRRDLAIAYGMVTLGRRPDARRVVLAALREQGYAAQAISLAGSLRGLGYRGEGIG